MSHLSPQSFDSNRSGHNFSDVLHTIEVGHVVFNQGGETADISGDFQNNKYAVETLHAIVNDLRIHSSMKLTKDAFKGLTVQFSDHYYKIDVSGPDAIVHKYLLHMPNVIA